VQTPLRGAPAPWRPLPWHDWSDTIATLHMWTQIVGKIRMAQTPPLNHWWHVPLYVSARGLTWCRGPFFGKASPVHSFWGGFDLAVTRFSGRVAPPHPGGAPNCPDWVQEEAYSREVSSAGWWPSSAALGPAFYSYTYPQPAGFADATVRPKSAGFDATLTAR